ncbi:MAG: hypothetical protein V3R87_09365, partial [Dehalococcoidia bacterium]
GDPAVYFNSPLKYLKDLKHYAGKAAEDDLSGLVSELEYRAREGAGVPDEVIQRAAVVLHQFSMGR